MKKIGIITYECLYCNFTNYGTALQTWALQQAIRKIDADRYDPILIYYCPDTMSDKDPLNPIKNMWDIEEEARAECERSLPAIRINFEKIMSFYNDKIKHSKYNYTSKNLEEVVNEGIYKFICGSDSIWDITEFNIDKAYWADYNFMKGNSIAYAPSLQDSFEIYLEYHKKLLDDLIKNYIAIGIRDEKPFEYVQKQALGIVKRVADPTLLLEREDYMGITASRLVDFPYILYYSRRYNQEMEAYVEKIASQKNIKVIEISLRASNQERHHMFYEAGVEEFLSLVKYADCVVTNSFHCIIFAIQFQKEFWAFTREHCNNKIVELLKRFGISNRLVNSTNVSMNQIKYEPINQLLTEERKDSMMFLKDSLEKLCSN